MEQPISYSIFSSVAAFSRGEPTSLPYLFNEKGYLLDLDPEERAVHLTSKEYYPLTGHILALKSKPEKIDYAPNKWDSTKPPKGWEELFW